MNWEVVVIRKLFFLEIVEGFNDVYDDLEYFLITNNEIVEDKKSFSKWVEESKCVETLKKWLEEKALEHFYDEVYKPTGREERIKKLIIKDITDKDTAYYLEHEYECWKDFLSNGCELDVDSEEYDLYQDVLYKDFSDEEIEKLWRNSH